MDDVSTTAETLLTSEPLMIHLATCRDGHPHVAPVWYRYENGTIEVVTTGLKLENIRANPKVALSVQSDDNGETKWMVSLLGTATIVTDEESNRQATRRINEKYGVPPDAYADNTLVRIDIGSVSYSTY